MGSGRREHPGSARARAGWGAGQRGKKGWYDQPRDQRADNTRTGTSADDTARAEHHLDSQAPHGGRRLPWDEDPDYVPRERSAPRHLPPLPPDHPSYEAETEPEEPREPRRARPPRKLTVTRVAAWRSRDLTKRAMRLFFSAANADGADQSGLAKFTYAVMFDYAVDAAMAVALANTLFFSAATGESKDKVALYLLITVAPFALVAPVIGPALDRIQQGRRAALASSLAIRALLAVVMALNFDSWLLYPAALGCMVVSKSFSVLKAAMTPRVLPSEITLTKANSRLTTFGMAAGGVFGAIASGFSGVFGSQGALWFMAAMSVAGVWLCLRIPGWVESTEGEIPAAITGDLQRARTPMATHVVVALWGNGGIRLLTGFLTLFAAFVIKQSTQHDPLMQLVQLGLVGGAAGIGSFLGNAAGARMHFGKPDRLILACLGGALAISVCAALLPSLALAVIVGLVGATASALAKVCLDAVVQRDMPEESRASAFGRSETILQLSWVFGGALGVLLPPVYWIGFTVVAALLALLMAQTVVVNRGSTLLPRLRRSPAAQPEPPAETLRARP